MPSSRTIRIEKARTLLQRGVPGPGGLWADLGCGDGIFTSALYALIQPGGEIYAVDKSQPALGRLARDAAEQFPDGRIHLLRADFTDPLALPPLDGIVMANSLHFFRKKAPIIARLSRLLKPRGRLIVVEYDTAHGSFAVPHPLDAAGFLKLAGEAGLTGARIIARIPSTYLGQMYAAVAYAPPGAAAGRSDP